MSYKASYRKYRPNDFSSVKGQNHVMKTLMNSLKNEAFSHAYIFNGPRGTGKTTIAKIVAKTLNCVNYPASNPCLECESCLSIANNSNPNVIELDAASNNGVDEVRSIIENIKFVPSNNRFKIYIIDEVHMLSNGAFNALLKTLEEPPSHAIFILCTTEIHKIPLTIISRTQRFDFLGISVKDIFENLSEIKNIDGVEISDEAIELIARLSEGGMRDALSLYDQVVAYSSENITVDDVYQVSGAVSLADYIELTNYILDFNVSKSLEIASRLVDSGKEIKKIIASYIEFFKDILLYKNNIIDDMKYVFLDSDFIKLASEIDLGLVYYYIEILSKTQNDIKYSLSAKTYLDLAVIKLSEKQVSNEAVLLNKINKLENEIALLSQGKIQILNETKLEEDKANEKKAEETKEKSGFDLDLGIIDTYIEELDKKKKPKNKQSTKEEVEIINPYSYDASKDLETLEALKSSRENNLFSKNLENLEEKIVVDEIPVVVEEKVENDEVIDITSQIFDENIVLEVLMYGIKNRQSALDEKEYIKKKWNFLSVDADANIYSIVSSFEKFDLAAFGKGIMILIGDDVDMIISLMKPDVKEKIKNLLRKVYNNDFDYLILPEPAYMKLREEFINQYRSGNLKPTLSKIEYPGLKITKVLNPVKSDIIQEAINLVGAEKVTVRR